MSKILWTPTVFVGGYAFLLVQLLTPTPLTKIAINNLRAWCLIMYASWLAVVLHINQRNEQGVPLKSLTACLSHVL